MKIKDAFEKTAAPVKAYSKPGDPIALRHAMKNYLGRGSGLAAAIQAVVNGTLVPVGCTQRFRGITGYLFLSEQLRRYRPCWTSKCRAKASSITGRQQPYWGSKHP